MASVRRGGLLLALLCESVAFAQGTVADGADDEVEDVTALAPLNVKADRVEEFGFRVGGQFAIPGPSYAMITEVFPNTAASKAGLRPGELISKVDGKKRSMLSLLMISKAQDKKWAQLAAGKKSVTWSFDVRAPDAAEARTVTMTIPTPAPHWGSAVWRAPEGRTPAVVREAGPLAERAREILDNGIWTLFRTPTFLGERPINKAPILGYEWRIVRPTGTHRLWVTQQRGETEIVLEHRSHETGNSLFITSPSGALEKTSYHPPKKKKKKKEQLSQEELRARFQEEVDFWLTKVGRVTGRWPLEALDGDAAAPSMAMKGGSESRHGASSPALAFLNLPVATAEQKALFADALGKVGLDEECWAYTETSHGFGDDRVTTVRIDPSKPLADRSTLLKVNGKAPKSAVLKQWREEDRGAPAVLGELPAISSVVDLDDVRVFSDEVTAVVFELSVKSSGTDFPGDKFQALFRVNKTQRGFEDFSVKLRESMRVAGVAKVTDAGMEVRFQSFDPALAPQPVLLKAGGGVRVLLVKFSRAFETTRADFVKVFPYQEGAGLEL